MKKCTGCNVWKPEDAFNWQNKSKGTRQAKCKSCKSEYAKARWASGDIKESNYESKARRVERAREAIWEILSKSACADCGETNPVVLEFDHLGDKFKNVSAMVSSNYGVEAIKKEMNKCEVVCANHHRIRTAARAGTWKHTRSLP